MSNSHKKMLALLVAGILVVTGVAWAAVQDGIITSDVNSVSFPESEANQDLDINRGAVSLDNFTLSATPTNLTGGILLPVLSGDFGFVGYTISPDHPRSARTPRLNWADLAPTGFGLRTRASILVNAGQTLTLKPVVGSIIGGTVSQDLQVLRLDGTGTTVVYGGNGNAPTNAVYNNFYGGTFLMGGTLQMAHTNSLGLGPVMLNEGSTLDIFDADVSIGKEYYGMTDGANIIADQVLWLRRHENVSHDFTMSDTPGVVTVNVASDNQFEVGTQVSESTTQLSDNVERTPNAANDTLVDLSSIVTVAQQQQPQGTTRTGASRGVTLVKTGTGTMKITGEGLVNQSGATHSGGTNVVEGGLTLLPATTNAYIGMLGFTYEATVEADSAKKNFGAIARFNNHLSIAEDAYVTVNRDQFFGNISGAGTFNTQSWNASGLTKRFPQLTFQADGVGTFAASPQNEPSYFSGLLNGPLDLVVNTHNGNVAGNLGQEQMIAIGNPNNTISEGVTMVVDGALSVPGTNAIPPGNIYVGVKGTTEDRDFVTQAIPTLHADGTFNVANNTYVSDFGFVPNLSTNRANIVSYSNVFVDGSMSVNLDFNSPALALGIDPGVGVNQVPNPRYMAGTVAFSDEYTFTGNAADPTDVFVVRGMLHLEKLPVSGWATLNVGRGATLSLGDTARDFSSNADLSTWDDSRIRVILKDSDFYTSKNAARNADAVAEFDYFTNNLGRNYVSDRENRLVIQLDASQLPNKTIPAGTWIKILEVYDSPDWNDLHLTRSESSTADEDYAKIRIANVDDITIHGDTFVAVLDETRYAVYLYASEAVDVTDPVTPPTPSQTSQEFIDGMTAAEKAKLVDGFNFIASNGVVIDAQNWTTATGSITAYLLDVADDGTITVNPAYNGTTISATLTDEAGNVVKTVTGTVTDGKVTLTFPNLDELPNGTYTLVGVAVDADGNVVPGSKVVITLNIAGGEVIGGSGSSGCDAGFGAFALLALGAAVVLRKKD